MQSFPLRRAPVLAAAIVAVVGGLVEFSSGADVLWDAPPLDPAGGDRRWTNPTNWAGDAVPTANDTAVFGPGASAGPVSLSGTTGSTIDVDGVRFTAADELYALSLGVLRLNRIDVTGNAVSSSNSGHVISATLTTAGPDLTINVSNGNSAIPLNLNGNVGLSGGPPQTFSLTKEGASAAYVRGAALYTGATNVNNGTLEFRGANGRALGSSAFNIRTGGILTLNSVEAINNNRIGDTAAINLHGGMFNTIGAAPAGGTGFTAETLGTIRFGGGDSILQATSTAGAIHIDASALARGNRATGLVRGANLGTFLSTPAARIRFATAPTADLVGAGTSTAPYRSIIPYLLGDSGPLGSGNRFVTYDTAPAPGGGVIGLRPLKSGEWATAFTDGTASANNVHLSSDAVANNTTTINSLFLEGSSSVTGTGTLNVTSGAIAGVGTSPTSLARIGVNRLHFGGREGVFHAVVHGLQVDSDITGTNGITKSGSGELVLTGNNGYSGTTTVNNGTITFRAPNSLAPGSDVAVFSGGSVPTTLKFLQHSSEITRYASNPIVLRGDAPARIATDYARSLTNFDGLHLLGPISGEGGLLIDGGAVLLGGASTYSGGTRVSPLTHLLLGHDSALGTGPLTTAAGNSTVLRTFGGARTISNDVIAEGDLVLNASGGSLTLSGDVSAVGASRVINVSNAGMPSGNTVTLSGTLTAPAPGTWTLTGAYTLRLNTTAPVADRFHLHAGTLVLGNNALANDVTMGQAGIPSNGTTLYLDTALNDGADYAFDHDITVNGGSSGGQRIGGQHSAGTVTYNGTIMLGSEVSPGTFLPRSVTLFQPAGGTTVFAGAIGDPAASLQPAGVTVSGGGTVRFRAPAGNTYRGTTNAVGGTTIHIEPGVSMAGKLYTANGGHIVLGGSVPTDSTLSATSNGTMMLDGPYVLGGITAASHGIVNVAAGGSNTLRTAALTIDDTGKLQLNDNDLLVDYTGDSIESAIRNLVIRGRDTGFGITTLATGDGDTVLAIVDNLEWGRTSYNGFDIDDTTIIGKYTYYGDANLDGKVTGDDYVAIDSNLGTGDSWIEGDFNMDGRVSGDDYVAIDSNLGHGTADPLALAVLKAEMVALHVEMFGEGYLDQLAAWEAAVPEPSAGLCATAVVLSCGLLRRRRESARAAAGG